MEGELRKRGDLWGEVWEGVVEGGGEGEAGRVEGFEVGEGTFVEVRGFPELGGFIHVLVEPLVAEGEVEGVDEEREVRVEGLEEKEEVLEEGEGYGIVVVETA